MATLPVATCARMLGIHPKTLHHWLTQANLPLAPHATDARIKWVTEEPLLAVARRPGRPLPALPAAPKLDAGSAPGSQEEPAKPLPTNQAGPDYPGASRPATSPPEAHLIQHLSCLETQIVTLQEHLAQLALAVLQERERSVEHRIAALETITAELVGRPVFSAALPDAQATGTRSERVGVSHSPRQLNPAEQRAWSRMPPLIEYSAQGTYVISSAQEGELHLVPDSPQGFEWVASLSSLRFVGQQGCFTASREHKHHGPTRSWRAHRRIHQHNYKHSLGVTDQLSINRLEQVATLLQSHLASV